ncbi:MAG: amidohydrolase family protein, partial [Pseudomonadales bacterium]|nr:amidohydrolase [Pseudomonadales bacterium]NIX09651.1 amidohydrolase family protein [Pseudomonadales bacterium]
MSRIKTGAETLGLAHLGVVALLTLAACDRQATSPPADALTGPQTVVADRLFVGDNILTMDDALADATAVAIRGEEIVWVGRAENWSGNANETVELGERSLLPGLIDAHGHLAFLALTVNLANVASPPVGAVTTMASLKEVVRTYIDDRQIPPGQWVIGMGYDDSLIEEQRHPDRSDLDAISRDHPIALIHVSGHLTTVNSMALDLSGITAETPDPPGGAIRRQPGTNEPNGILEETATAPLRHIYYGGGDATTGADLRKALAMYAENGVTTVQDGGASWEIHEMVKEASIAGDVNLDVVLYPVGMDPTFSVPDGVPLGEYQDRVKVGGIKLLLDGSPQGKTAYLSEPYEVPPHGQRDDYRGYPMIPQAMTDERVAHFIGRGIPMLVHCNGDAAAEMLLDALDKAGETMDLGDHRTVMIHAQTVREDQLDRMAELGVVPSYFSAHTFYWGDWHRDSVLGVERASRISPTRTTLERGMPFTVHNDAPVVPPDMMRLLWATVNRITRSGQTLGEAQRISALEAIRAVTVHAAYQNFEEDLKGTLTPGKQADLVILSANPVTVSPEQILDIEVVETISRGVTVYQE